MGISAPMPIGMRRSFRTSSHHVVIAPSTRPDPDALDRVLHQQLDVISRHQALAAGVTKHAQRAPPSPRRAVAEPAARHLHRLDRHADNLAAGDGRTAVARAPAASSPARRPCVRHPASGPGSPSSSMCWCPPPGGGATRPSSGCTAPVRMPGRIWEARPGAVRAAGPRRCRRRPRPDQPAGRARGAGRRGAARQKYTVRDLAAELGPSPVQRRFRPVPRGAHRRHRRHQVGRRRRPRDLLARSGLPMPLFNPSVYDDAAPSSPGPMPGGGLGARGGGRFVGVARLSRGSRRKRWPAVGAWPGTRSSCSASRPGRSAPSPPR